MSAFIVALHSLTDSMPDAAILLLGSQITFILRYFLARNIHIARERAWDQTVASRGKGAEFWQPYVEEWESPPLVQESHDGLVAKVAASWVGRLLLKRGMNAFPSTKTQITEGNLVLLIPFNFYPFIGIAISAGLKAFGTARYLHKQVCDTAAFHRPRDNLTAHSTFQRRR